MLHRAFWTERRFTGLLLILGFLLYVAAVVCMPRDAHGTLLVLLSDNRTELLVVAAQPTFTQLCFGLFISGTIVTPLGLTLLTRLLWETGDRTWSYLGLIAALFGAVLLVIYISVSLGITLLAGGDTVRTGVVPGYYTAVGTTIQPLFIIYTLLTLAALLAYGGAILTTHVLPQWVGWVTIAFTLFNLASAGFAGGNVAPIVHYLMPLVMGIILLVRRTPRTQSQHAEFSPAPAASAVPGGER
jgi:hypothetical protein